VGPIKKIKLKFGNYTLKRKLKSFKRTVEVKNLHDAKSIGILFDQVDDESFIEIKAFLNYLAEKRIQVFALGFIHHKKIPEKFLMRKGFNFFCMNDLNWNLTPKAEIANQFIKKKFDILIDISKENCFPVKYIGSLSKAVFKVGRNFTNKEHLDLVINTNEQAELTPFIENMKHYLGRINHHQE